MNDIDNNMIDANNSISTREEVGSSKSSPIPTTSSTSEAPVANGTHDPEKSLTLSTIETHPSPATDDGSTTEVNQSTIHATLNSNILEQTLESNVPISASEQTATTQEPSFQQPPLLQTQNSEEKESQVIQPDSSAPVDAFTPVNIGATSDDAPALVIEPLLPPSFLETPSESLIEAPLPNHSNKENDGDALTPTKNPNESQPTTFHSPLPDSGENESFVEIGDVDERREEHDDIDDSRGSLLSPTLEEEEVDEEVDDLVKRNRRLEEKLAKANATIAALESSDTHEEVDTVLEELQTNLEVQMDRRAKAEAELQQCQERANQLEQEWEKQKQSLQEQLQQLLEQFELRTKQIQQQNQTELVKLRDHLHDEHQRKEHALICRVNEAKKKEAVEANRAERLEGQLQMVQAELEDTKEQLVAMTESKQKAEVEWNQSLQQCRETLQHTEKSLAEERRLNEERKRKMKAFVESKAEELRISREETTTLQAELDQTNRSLLDLNNRWKQLHAQWVQSQTRNRELQRDLNRIQKDSETLHRVGGTLEMKLERSAQETEEHKNKRLTAKHELMTVLRSLDVEKEASAKLRDSIKFTFTPKALSQQQLLKECLSDLDNELSKLSRRMGRPLATSSMTPEQQQQLSWMDLSSGSSGAANRANGISPESDLDSSETNNNSITGSPSKRNKSALETDHLLSNLEDETQRVSQCIMRLTYSVEQLHQLMDDRGNRSCMTMLSNLMGAATGAASSATPASPRSNAMNDTSSDGGGFLSDAASSRLGLRRYGQIPAHDSILT